MAFRRLVLISFSESFPVVGTSWAQYGLVGFIIALRPVQFTLFHSCHMRRDRVVRGIAFRCYGSDNSCTGARFHPDRYLYYALHLRLAAVLGATGYDPNEGKPEIDGHLICTRRLFGSMRSWKLSPLHKHRHYDVDVVVHADGADRAGAGGGGDFQGYLGLAED